ncbi:MAG: serine hydrolase domain-containing protein, partial [Myxococcales bacterium]
RASWPTQGWTSRAEQVAKDRAARVAALEQYAFTLTGSDEERKGIRTDGVVIVHGGEVVYERYGRGFTAEKRHLSWSVSKSFTNALTGLAVAEGAITLDDSVCKHLTLSDSSLCAITVRHLLEFASGIDWRETYEGQSNQVSSVLAMLYGEGRRDIVSFVASHPLRDPPGETFMYSSGDTNLLAGVLTAALKPRHGERFPFTLLLEPLGMRSATWERDGKGVIVGSSYLYATPRDLAKFGYFLLSDGCWEGRRLLPEGWVEASTALSEPFRKRPLEVDEDDRQGRQFWLNKPVPEQNKGLAWPDVPEDAFAARGHWGQSITVIPSLDLVIVRVADDRESGAFQFNTFVPLAIAVARDR